MATWSGNPQVRPIGTERGWILQNSRTATAGSTFINEADFMTQFARVSLGNDILWYELEVIPVQGMPYHVADEP